MPAPSLAQGNIMGALSAVNRFFISSSRDRGRRVLNETRKANEAKKSPKYGLLVRFTLDYNAR